MLFWVGAAMVAAGLALLGYLAWQFWGTNWVADRHQREITQQLQQEWRQGRAKGEDLSPKRTPQGEATALIRIPRFGKHYVVPVLEGTSQDVLARGFGHFTGTAGPGQVGNYALAGHRITHGEPLAGMPELRPGDKVIVETARTTYTYVLDTNPNDLIVDFTQTWVIDPHPHNPDPGGVQPSKSRRLITLTTCSELFHTNNRMIAFGHLVQKAPRGR
ncbi:MAG TPA: class E sortase [Marmoricola sp.]|nr:class E sortase [Marmoricola sp.]